MASKAERVLQALGALIGWFAVFAQLYLIIENRVASVPETIVRFFSFYTILTNILVATCLTISFLKPSSRLGIFFNRYTTVTALTVYITVVGIVYNLILRTLWQPEGMQRLVDELLHSVIPVLFIIYWIIVRPKNKVEWKRAFNWLLYPLVYLVYILLRGKFSGFYPYPFVDVTKLGYSQVLMNCCYLFLAFLIISFMFILIARRNVRAMRVQF